MAGGAYEIDNLRSLQEQEAVRRYSLLVREIAGVPDGATVSVPVMQAAARAALNPA